MRKHTYRLLVAAVLCGLLCALSVPAAVADGVRVLAPPEGLNPIEPPEPPVGGTDYFGYAEFGGTWCDAEKSPTNTEDDEMCWAATASNVLDWTGWGYAPSEGFSGTDDMFAYFQDHWTDVGGNMYYGWDWWFDGTNDKQGEGGWSQVDVAGGGFWEPPYNFDDYCHLQLDPDLAMSAIDDYLHAGYGVGLGLYDSGGHAVTCWGLRVDETTGDYLGVWITDSDDDKNDPTPEDQLQYYSVARSGGRWYLQDFYGTWDEWYIGEVQGVEPVAEPAGLALLALGGVGVILRRRRS